MTAAACRDGAAHVLVLVGGSAGDMYPYLHLARGLRERGHRVTVLGPAVHAAMGAAAQVDYVGLGTEQQYLALLDHPDIWHPRRGFAVLWQGVRDGFAPVGEAVASRPPGERLALLAHPLALPAAALARAARPGLRIVTAWLAPANLRSVHDPLTIGPLRIAAWVPFAWRRALWRHVDRAIVDPVALADLNDLRAAHGLAPVEHVLDHLESVADASVALFPPWFAPTPPDWPPTLAPGAFPLYDPTRQPDAPLAADLEAFLGAGPAPIVFTPGSGNRQAARWFERALAATRRLGRRAVFLSGHRAQIPAALPATVCWQAYVPLGALLPRAAALVHHGGIGTTAAALRAGVPQLILPSAYDQFDNAARVEALAAGRRLAAWRARPRGLAAAIAALLASAPVRAGCAAAARRVTLDARVDLAALVEQRLGIATGSSTIAPAEPAAPVH